MNIRKITIYAVLCFMSAHGFGQQIGVVDDGIYYGVNSSIVKGETLQLVDVTNNKIYCCAKITSLIYKNNEHVISDSVRDRTIVSYLLTMPKNAPRSMSGFGIIGNAKLVKRRKDVNITLDHGLDVILSSCTSSEGVHYVGRRSDNGKIIVDFYKYLNADLDATCKNLK